MRLFQFEGRGLSDNFVCRCISHPLLRHVAVWWAASLLHGAGFRSVQQVRVSQHLEKDLPGA
jgi:hypothetical protein